MKSVGEVMAIGRTFAESLQKALRGLETGLTGLDEIEIAGADDPDTGRAAVIRALGTPTPDRLRVIAQAFRHGLTVEEVNAACSYEPWFLRQIAELIAPGGRIRDGGLPTDAAGFRALKAQGFSDARLAKLTGADRSRRPQPRHGLNVRPVFKRIDTCAGEFARHHALHVLDLRDRRAGPGPRVREPSRPTARRRSSWAAVPTGSARASSSTTAAATPPSRSTTSASSRSWSTATPETVSTDYDTSDRLYFEPLTAEDVLELIARRACAAASWSASSSSSAARPR